jgi:uncharacterized protein YbjT (DUF2867 family)
MNRRTLINQLSAALLAGVVSLIGVGCADADQVTAQDRGLVLVAGATGRTGRLVVSNLLEQGYPVRALVRDMERGHEILGDGVEFAEGDVRDIDSLRAAMQGAASLIITIGSSRKDPDNGPEFVDYGGVKNLAQAAADTGVQQVVLMSSAGVTHEDHVLNQMFDNILIWKSRGEDALRDSGVDYTIVRPGGLMDSPGGETAVVFEQGDSSTGMISREDVALVCVAALQTPAARNKTFEVFGSEERAPNDWTNLYSDLQSDNKPNE